MCIACGLFGGCLSGCLDYDDDQPPKVERLKCKTKDFLNIHLEDCRSSLALGGPAEEYLVAQLFDRATDVRNLEAAWRYLEKLEQQSPGTTGFAPAVGLTDKQIRPVLKQLRSSLRNSEYVPKEIDPFCWILLADVGTQVGQTAMCAVVEPLLTDAFGPLTLATGSEDARLEGLSVTLNVAEKEDRFVWVLASVKDPFNNVPQDPLFAELWEILPNAKCFELITGLTWMPAPNGISEDCRLSELLIDLYLDRVVVREWRHAHKRVPLLRCGADFLVLCRAQKDATRMRADLLNILGGAGMPVDEAGGSSIRDLATGDSAEWLGHVISHQVGGWDYRPAGLA